VEREKQIFLFKEPYEIFPRNVNDFKIYNDEDFVNYNFEKYHDCK